MYSTISEDSMTHKNWERPKRGGSQAEDSPGGRCPLTE